MPDIICENVTKCFGKVQVLKAVSFTHPAGQWSLLTGRSGAGKTTLIRLIAGLERPDAGAIRFDTEVVSTPGRLVPPERRCIGMVFQGLALWPHMTVEQHLNFVLKPRIKDRRARGEATGEWLTKLHLETRRHTFPDELSGGEKQRIALGRALSIQPDILLLDEPFTGLDSGLRAELLDVVQALTKVQGVSVLCATHYPGQFTNPDTTILELKDGRINGLARAAPTGDT